MKTKEKLLTSTVFTMSRDGKTFSVKTTLYPEYYALLSDINVLL
jgi:hypothetical protein